MSENTRLSAGTNDGDTFGADDIAGVKFPRSKIIIGADGTNDGDVSAANPLPVTVSGTVTVGSHAVTNIGTFAVQATVAAAATNIAKAEDAASVNADVGVPAMAIRRSSPNDSSDADGDYEMLQMNDGRLWVSAVLDTALPAGTNAIGKLAANAGVTIGAVELAAAQTLATVTTVTTVSTITNVVHIDDNSGSLTVDAPVGTPVFVRLSDGTSAISTLPVSLASLPALATGANQIGKLAANSGVDIGDVDVTSLPALAAGTNLVGKVVASPDTDTIYQGTTALTVKYAKISCASSGENTLVAAVASKKIKVHSIALFGVGTAVSIYFKDAASGSAIFADGTNPIPIDKSGAAGAGGFVLGPNPQGWMQSASGGALILNLSAAQAVAGCLQYTEVS